MQLTGLESLLLGGGLSTASVLATAYIKDLMFRRRAASAFVHRQEYTSHRRLCEERFNQGNDRMEHTQKEMSKLAKMFERFIVYSDLPNETKAKILNGGT